MWCDAEECERDDENDEQKQEGRREGDPDGTQVGIEENTTLVIRGRRGFLNTGDTV